MFFVKVMKKKYCIAFVTEDFFEDGLAKTNKFNGLFYFNIWYNSPKMIIKI